MFRLRSIDYIRLKIKALGHFIDRGDIYAILAVIFVGFSSFILGRASIIEETKPPVTIEWIPLAENRATTASQTSDQGLKPAEPSSASPRTYVGSKSGDKYHLPTCSGAQRIAEANKVWFSTKEEAERAGYSPASNCKGI